MPCPFFYQFIMKASQPARKQHLALLTFNIPAEEIRADLVKTIASKGWKNHPDLTAYYNHFDYTGSPSEFVKDILRWYVSVTPALRADIGRISLFIPVKSDDPSKNTVRQYDIIVKGKVHPSFIKK